MSNRLKLWEEKMRLYIMKHCLSMEPMCHCHILRKRQNMPATVSFKSGKAETLSYVTTAVPGSGWDDVAGDAVKVWDLHVQWDRGCHFLHVPCAQCWHVWQDLGLSWCSPAWEMQCFPSYGAYIRTYGFRLNKQPEKLLFSWEIIYSDF